MRLLLDVSAVPARPVGAGNYVLALAAELARSGAMDLHLLARRGDAARFAEIAPEATCHAVVPQPRPTRLAWEQARAPGFAQRLGVDVWHGPHYTLPLRARTIGRVVTVHDLTFFDHPEWHERSKVAFFRPTIRAAVSRADVVVVDSTATADRLAALLHPAAPVLTVPLGVDLTRFKPAPPGDPGDLEVLRPLGVRPPYVAFLGTLEPRKNVPTLVRAFSQLASGRPELRLVLAGADGWGASEVRAEIARSGVATRILRTGYVPSNAVPPLLRQAAAVVYPSIVEGFGLPALEALGCGAPLITSRGTSMAEVTGDAALLVTPRDADGLARELARLLEEPGLAARLREQGPQRAATYTWVAAARGHLGAYTLAAAAVGGTRGAVEVSSR
ncbi:MAG: glycosyltransferase family 4 protein [Acidimicrobiia bacterium]